MLRVLVDVGAGGERVCGADVAGDDAALVGEGVDDDGDEAGCAEGVTQCGFVGVDERRTGTRHGQDH